MPAFNTLNNNATLTQEEYLSSSQEEPVSILQMEEENRLKMEELAEMTRQMEAARLKFIEMEQETIRRGAEIENRRRMIEEEKKLEQRNYQEKHKQAMNRIFDFLSPKEDDTIGNVASVKNKIITAPTQVGKTSSIIELIRKSKKWLTVVSCDNKKDQLLQIVNRLNQAKLNAFEVNKCKKQQFNKMLLCLAKKKPVTLVMLNNASQIGILSNLIDKIRKNIKVDNYICIHDEADMVNKADNINDLDDNQIAISHREWILHFSKLKGLFSRIRRVWVTATCENCSNIQNIKAEDIVVLPTPLNYVPVNTHIEWTGDNTDLYNEIERIRLENKGEVILYCYNTLIKQQFEHAVSLSREHNCITIVYNSDDRRIFGHSEYNYFTQSIDDILEDIKDTGKPVVIFGCDLMSRGMSFVGRNDKPLTATVLFHKDTSSTTAVNIAQKFGRITGTSRPDLSTRRVYCTNRAYEDYQGYLNNQKGIYSKLKEYPDLNMTEILKLIDSTRLSRKVDRPSLKKVNTEYYESSSYSDASSDTASESPAGPTDTVKMHRLVKSWINIKNKNDIARLFRQMLNSPNYSLLTRDVSRFIKNPGAILQLTTPYAGWNSVFKKDNEYHRINEEAIDYYTSLVQ